MSEPNLSPKAYRKMMLHCLRYASQNVVGLLIGNKSNVEDAYPLFHTPIVNPSLEIGMELVEAQLSEGQHIVGLYYSNIHTADPLDSQDKTFAAIMEVNGAQSILIGITMERVGQETILSYHSQVGKEPRTQSKQHQFLSLKDDIMKGNHRLIVDLDSHFENIELDFTNPYIS